MSAKKVLVFASIVEIGTGLVVLIDPSFVARWLLGGALSGAGRQVGRAFGLALLGLSVSCWPRRDRVESGSAALWGMLTYNALIAVYLAAIGATGRANGILLWPAVVLHAVVAFLLAGTGARLDRSIEAE